MTIILNIVGGNIMDLTGLLIIAGAALSCSALLLTLLADGGLPRVTQTRLPRSEPRCERRHLPASDDMPPTLGNLAPNPRVQPCLGPLLDIPLSAPRTILGDLTHTL